MRPNWFRNTFIDKLINVGTVLFGRGSLKTNCSSLTMALKRLNCPWGNGLKCASYCLCWGSWAHSTVTLLRWSLKTAPHSCCLGEHQTEGENQREPDDKYSSTVANPAPLWHLPAEDRPQQAHWTVCSFPQNMGWIINLERISERKESKNEQSWKWWNNLHLCTSFPKGIWTMAAFSQLSILL